jgi:uncharacterized protein
VLIGYVVDVHDHFESVVDVLKNVGDVDVLLVGGDITTFGTPEDAERAMELWSQLVPRVLAVSGNMDSPEIDLRLGELGVSIDARACVIDDVGFAGVSAAPRSPLHTPYELEDDEIERRGEAAFEGMRGARVRIFCPHAPPHDTECDRLRSGEHVGSIVLRRLIEREQPDLVLCGHIHEARGVDFIGDTRIVNPGPVTAGHYAVCEVGETLSLAVE